MDPRADEFTLPEEVTVKLKRPLKKTASEEVLTHLSFRPPSVREMRQILKTAGEDAATAGISLLVLLNKHDLVAADIDRLAFLDFQLIQEALAPFLELKPPSAAESN